MMVHTSNGNTQEVEVLGHPWIHGEFEVTPGYIRLYFNFNRIEREIKRGEEGEEERGGKRKRT